MEKKRERPKGIFPTAAVVTVGKGRGFIITAGRDQRYVVTAAHCLPKLPEPHAAEYASKNTWPVLAPLGEEPSVYAEWLFADPVADIAVFGRPDDPTREHAKAYDQLVKNRPAFKVGEIVEETPGKGFVLTLENCWAPCMVQSLGGPLDVTGVSIQSGMSGSPILAEDGSAIGVISTGSLNPHLMADLPGRLLAELKLPPKGLKRRLK